MKQAYSVLGLVTSLDVDEKLHIHNPVYMRLFVLFSPYLSLTFDMNVLKCTLLV